MFPTRRSWPARIVDHADVAGHHPPAVWASHPGLGLTPHLARRGVAVEERRGDRIIAAIGGDDRLRQDARQANGGPRGAKRLDLIIAVQILRRAIADRARI